MSIEAEIKALREAVEANTAAIKAAGAAGAATTKGTTTKTTKAETKVEPKNSRESVEALLRKVKSEISGEKAKALISEEGGVEKMADIPEDKLDTVFDAATKALEDAM